MVFGRISKWYSSESVSGIRSNKGGGIRSNKGGGIRTIPLDFYTVCGKQG